MTTRKTLYGLVHKGAEVKFGCLPVTKGMAPIANGWPLALACAPARD